MKDFFKFLGIAVIAIFSLTNCPNPVGLDSFSSGKKDTPKTGENEQSPWKKDFDITGLSLSCYYNGKEKEVSIEPKPA
jgi:hypothetical protein